MFAKLKIKHKLVSLLSIALIGVFAFIIVNKSLYIHSHALAFGQVATHAHPFEKPQGDKPKPHSHTQAEMLLLDQINALFFSILIVLILGLLIAKIKFHPGISLEYIPAYLFNLRGRSPPF